MMGTSKSSMVSFTFTMSVMTWQPASVTSQSPKTNFLISCSIKFIVVRLVSGENGHCEHVVGVLLGVLLRNLLLDLLQDFRWVPERFGSWERLSLLRKSAVSTNRLHYHVSVQQTGSTTMQVFGSCCQSVFACGAFGLPTAFPCGHSCTAGIDRDVASKESANPLWLL